MRPTRRRAFVDKFTAIIRPLDIAANRAWWDANITGKDEDFQRKEDAQNKIDAVLADKKAFAEVKQIKEAGGIDDPLIKRAIDVIYLAYLEKQLEEELLRKMTALGNAVEKKFSMFRANVDGKELSAADVRKILKTSADSKQRQAVYEAAKEVGEVVAPELMELVKLRNKGAKARLRELPRDAALSQRAERRRPDQAVRRARRADARAVQEGQGGNRRRAGKGLRHQGR